MAGTKVQELTRQNAPRDYLIRSKLEAKLKELFPEVKDFQIKVDMCGYVSSMSANDKHPNRCRMMNFLSSHQGQSQP